MCAANEWAIMKMGRLDEHGVMGECPGQSDLPWSRSAGCAAKWFVESYVLRCFTGARQRLTLAMGQD